jgi:hypothetical protein
MSDKKTIITLNIELPKEYADGLPDIFWTRLELLITDLFRLNQPNPAKFPVDVWRDSPCR